MSSYRRFMPILVLSVSLIALGTVHAQDEPADWTTFQPTGGPAYGLSAAALPDDEGLQKIYAAGPDVQTTTRGDEWVHAPGTGPVTSVLAGAEGVVFVAAEDGYGYRSTNDGRNWSRVRVRDDDPFRFAAVSPDYKQDKTVYAITSDAWRLYRSGNQGINWTEVTMELGVTDEYGAVGFSPLHYLDELIFVGTSRGLFQWSVAAQSWVLMSQPGGNTPKFGSAGGPLAEQGLVVPNEYGDDPDRREDPVVETLFAYNADGLFRTDDDGATWRQISLPASIERVNGLAVSNTWPTDPVLVVAGKGEGIVGAVSHDDGATWSLVNGPDGVQGASVVMSRDFARIPEKDFPIRSTLYLPYVLRGQADDAEYFVGSREVFIGTDGDGVYRSRDAGLTWERTAPTYTGVVVTALASLGDSDGAMLAGTETAGLFASEDGGRTWRFADAKLPRGRDEVIYAIRPSPAFASDKTVFLVSSSGVWRSRDSGRTWQLTSGPKTARSLALSPEYPTDGTLVAGSSLSTDGGDTWAMIGENSAWHWSAVAFSPNYAADRTIWFGTDEVNNEVRFGLFTYNVDSEAWAIVEESPIRNAAISSLFLLWVDPADDLRIFVGGSSGVVASLDGGETYKRVGGAVSRTVADVTGLAIRRPSVRGMVLAATVDGAGWSLDRGVTWSKEPRSPKPMLSTAMPSDGRSFVLGGPLMISRYELEPGD